MTKKAEFSRDSSSSFSEDTEETRVRKFSKHMLKSSMFIGTFLEKRFVEPLNSYRDVVKVADDETDLIENLKAVKKRCAKYFPTNFWIGITDPKTIGAPAGYSLWVELNEEVFGSYWYKIKNVEFYNNEIRIKLDIVRPVKESTPVGNITSQEIFQDISQGDVSDLALKCQMYFKDKLEKLFSETLTWANIKEASVFMLLLMSTLLTFLVHLTKYLMEYFLKLLREVQGLIKVCTPIIITSMQIIMNTINGFYTLILYMWRDRSTPRVNYNVYQTSPYQVQYHNLRALPYPSGGRYRGSSVKITPLD